MPAPLNLLHQTFGNLKVIQKLPSRNKKTYWQCQCQLCNSYYEIQTTHLRDNTYKKCCENNISTTRTDETRICPICKKQFLPKKLGHTRKFCYDCSPSYKKEAGKAQNITAIRKAIKKRLVEYKGGCCEKCGYKNCISALQFHHINPTEKDFNISTQLNLSDFNISFYYQEVDKCKLLCANCHAEEHDKVWAGDIDGCVAD